MAVAVRDAVGYSGTPLPRKLGYKAGMRTWFHAMPHSVTKAIAPEVIGVIELADGNTALDAAHIFVTERAALERHLSVLRTSLKPAGFVWVSWPKKASKMPTDITEDVIRQVCLPMGLVDVKVCAIDATWSGLKLMIRRGLR